jgi:MFS family permease
MNNKELCSTIKQNTIIVIANSIFFGFVCQILIVASPIIILDLTNSITLSSLTTSILFSADIFINYHAGKLCDKIGRKKILLIGTLIGFLAVSVLTISRLMNEESLYWLGLFFFGLGGGFIVLNRAALTDMYQQKRGQSLGYLNISGIAASFLATVFIASVALLDIQSSKNYYDILIFSCLPLLGFAGYIMTLMKTDTKIIGQELAKNKSTLGNKSNIEKEERWISEKYSRKDLLLAFLISSLSIGGIAIAMSLTPILLSIQNIETGAISFSLLLITLGANGLSILSGRISDKIGRRKVILFSGVLTGIGFILFSITNSYIILSLGAFIIGFGVGSLAIASTAWICDITTLKHRGKVFGTNSFVLNIISFISPIFAATLFDSFGSFSISVLGITVTLLVFLIMWKKS